MQTITLNEANELFKDILSQGLPKIQVTPTINKIHFDEDGCSYDLLFYKGNLVKIESYDKRELIEKFVIKNENWFWKED